MQFMNQEAAYRLATSHPVSYTHLLLGGDYQAVAHTIVNALAVVSGMVCAGAKPSCAAKIAAAIDAGILGYELYCRGQEFLDGDGIVRKDVYKRQSAQTLP